MQFRLTIPKGGEFYDTFAKAKPFESTRRQLFEQKVDKDEPKKPFRQYLQDVVNNEKHALTWIVGDIESYGEFNCKVGHFFQQF